MTDVLNSDWLWAVVLVSIFALIVGAIIVDAIAKRRKIKKLWDDWHRDNRK